jgi:hypothetical protein
MALDTYTNLKAAVASWLHRTDLTTQIVDFITLAEQSISDDLAGSDSMVVVQAGIALAQGASSFTLPIGARGLRTLRTTSPYATVVPIVSYTRMISETDGDSSITGAPGMAALVGNPGSAGTLTVKVYPTADQAYTLEATYENGVVPLSGAVASNFVLARAPSIYLAATMREAHLYMMDEERAGIWAGRYMAAIEAFKAQRWTGDVKLRTELAGSDSFDITTG